MRRGQPCCGSPRHARALSSSRLGRALDHLVDQAELLGLERRQELVALDGGRDHIERLAGVLDVDLVEPRPQR